MTDKDVTRRFFQTVFGEALKSGLGLILIWTMQDKISKYFSDIDEATDYAHSRRDTCDVYYGVSLCPAGLGEKERAKEIEVTGLVCLHADLDFAGSTKKKNYPKDADMVAQIVNDIGVRPSVISSTGGGMQDLWVIDGLWNFDKQQDRDEAKEMCRVWNMTIREICQSYGCTIDSTFDLARVLRPPGTFNHKYGKPLLVEMVECNDNVYMPTDLEQFMVTPEFCSRDDKMYVHVSDYKMPTADTLLPQIAKDLIEADGRVSYWWDKKRKDLPDQSASSYDLSIANEGVYRNWTEQQIVDTMMAWRVRHDENPDKLKRRKYVTNTIGVARSGRASEVMVKEVRDVVAKSDLPPDKAMANYAVTMPQKQRAQMLGTIGSWMGVKVLRVVQFGKENSLYAIDIESHGVISTINLGEDSVILHKDSFDKALFDPGLSMDYRGKNWRSDARIIRVAAEQIDVESFTEYAQTKAWLQHWFLDLRVDTGDDYWHAYGRHQPFVHNEELWIDIHKFKQHLTQRMDVKVDIHTLGKSLHGVGFNQNHIMIPKINQGWTAWNIGIEPLMKLGVIPREKLQKPDTIDGAA